MIIERKFTDPESLRGYNCSGIVQTNSSGVATITIKGKTSTDRIIGISLTLVSNTNSIVPSVYVKGISYSNGTTTITIQANKIALSGEDLLISAVPSASIHYSFFISDVKLTDLDKNDMLTQDY